MSLLLLPCMVSCTTKRHKQLDTSDAVVNGMSVVNTLCQAVTDKQSNKPPTSSCASPMKKAELHSMYMRQLGDLRQLYVSDTLKAHEYEEQWLHIVSLMRELK